MKEKLVVFLLFFFGIYYDSLISFLPESIKILDEFISLLLLPYILVYINIILKNKFLLRILGLLCSILFIGFLSSFYFEYQPIKISLLGALVYVKSYIPFLFFILFLNNNHLNRLKLYRCLKNHFHFSLLLIILGLLGQIVIFRGSIEFLGPLPQLTSYFNPKASYGIVISFLGLVFFYLNFLKKQPKFISLLVFTLLIISFRVKVFAFTGVLLVFIYSSNVKIFSFKNIMVLSLFLVVLVSLGGVSQLIEQKFVDTFVAKKADNRTARSELYINSIRISRDHFPLGTGFGTYGSHYSVVTYSPIYDMYNLDNVYGLTKKKPIYVNDTQWPPILVELGVFGFICYLLLLYNIFKLAQRWNADNKLIQVSISVCFLLLFINSIGMPVFFNSAGAAIFILIGLILMDKNILYSLKTRVL
ncbi:O-antigen ligase family protein [Leeuwenhoekiella sp. NPDC079379]|uniref:O-antigen ligase family protein n=1 Tax=Leeuwenhoekiella sp. NPDC079379 TaxID=3364122 RepID=UPI0037C927B6